MRPRVLVVEDSPVIRKLIGMCLASTNIDVDFHSDGADGLDAALADPPDAIVLDIGLPTMDGWEVLGRLRADERTRNLPAMVLTANAQDDVRRKGREIGASAALSKPFTPNDFRRAVLEMLASAHGNAVA